MYTCRDAVKSGASASPRGPASPWPYTTSSVSASSDDEVERLKMRTRPGRSVTKRRPSAANAIDHGTSRFETTVSTSTRTPSWVVKVVAGGEGVVGVGGRAG